MTLRQRAQHFLSWRSRQRRRNGERLKVIRRRLGPRVVPVDLMVAGIWG